MFWSNFGRNAGFEAIGLTDSDLQTVAVYAKGQSDDEPQKEDSEGNREQKDAAPATTASALKHKLPESKAAATTSEKPSDYRKGVVFYLKENKVVGIVLWNVFNRIPIARKVNKKKIFNFVSILIAFSFSIDYQRSRSDYEF